MEPVYIETKRLLLRPLLEKDFNQVYLSWLNDPVINEFSQRRPFPYSWEELRSYSDYYLKNPHKGFVLAMTDRDNGTHIGNISLVNIQLIHRCAEIAILIGDKSYWNKGLAAEAIYALTKHAFEEMNLHKLFAGTFNPSFARCVEKLGWKQEGVFRERIWAHGRYHDQLWHGILKCEFTKTDRFELGI